MQAHAETLSGAEKAAAVLLSLDKEIAQRLLKYFDRSELRQIAKTTSNLGRVSSDALEGLINEFLEQLSNSNSGLTATVARVEELLTGAAPVEDVSEIMAELQGVSNEAVWNRLATVPEASLASYLASEHPQTIAIVAIKIPASLAAKILLLLPGELRNDVLRRMLTTGPVSDIALRMLEKVLEEDVLGAPTSAPNIKVAAIVNQMEREQVNEVLESIAGIEPEAADQLKSLLFNFEDIGKLNPRARAVILDQVSTEQLIAALRGVDAALRDVILPGLSARMRRMVELELTSGEGPSRKEILAAQRAIAETVLRLAENGVIDLKADRENDAA